MFKQQEKGSLKREQISVEKISLRNKTGTFRSLSAFPRLLAK